MRQDGMRCVLVLLAAIGVSANALGQTANVGNNFGRQGDGFHEQIGVSWGLKFPGGQAQFGPQGADPNNAGGQAGVGFGNGDFAGRLNIFGAQSSQRSSGSFAPSATMTNGYGAMIADTRQFPFVIGVVPFVGNFPGVPLANQAAPAPPIQQRVARLKEPEPNRRPKAKPAPAKPAARPEPAQRDGQGTDHADPIASRFAAARASTAGQGAASVADIRRSQQDVQAAEEQELAEVLASAQQAEADGKLASARIFYQMAARRAAEPLKSELAERIQKLGR